MCRISKLHDTSGRRGPLGLWIPPHEFPVNKLVVRDRFDYTITDIRPTRNGRSELQNLVWMNPVRPRLLYSSSVLCNVGIADG